MKLKKFFKQALCFMLAVCTVLCLSSCEGKSEIRTYTNDDKMDANVNAKSVHIALTSAIAKMYQDGNELDELVITISNYDPENPQKSGKGGKGSIDKIYDDEGNVLKIDLSSMLGTDFDGYFLADVDVYDNNASVDYVEWYDASTFEFLVQNDSYGLPEGVTEENLLVGSFPL